jgi:parallel beta-helix repeat protein
MAIYGKEIKPTAPWRSTYSALSGVVATFALYVAILTPTVVFPSSRSPLGGNRTGRSCIPSGDHTSIQAGLTGVGSIAVLCPRAVFELGETILFTANNQSIYTEGYPTDSTRALLRIVGKSVATAISAEGNDYVSIKNVIIDGSRPALGIADGALINFGRGVLDMDAEGHVVEWVKAYEPRGWTVVYLGGPCNGAVARNNEIGPAGRAEYIMADGISLDCSNAIVENNTIIDATDGGIVIFQSPGALVSNNTIRAENRILFYGISMEDYLPLEGDFTGTRVTGNIIDAAGSMIRKGIGMGPHVGCVPTGEATVRSRGAIVTDNTLRGDYMAYGYVVSGVEDWTVTGNSDLSTHLVPEGEWDCFGSIVDPPAGFQYNESTSSGTFQAEFVAAVLGSTADMFPLHAVASESCMRDLIGDAVFEDIKAGNRGDLWTAMESVSNGERIGQCISIFQPPDISDLKGNVGLELLSCTPSCVTVRLFNLSEDTADLRRAEFLLDDFSVQCVGIPDSVGPWEEIRCTIEEFVTPGFHVLKWFGLPPGGDKWVFIYPFESTAVIPEELPSSDTDRFRLFQNYPNPFEASTTIYFTLSTGAGARVSLNIYDLQGRLVRTLIEADKPPGVYIVPWNGRDQRGNKASSGIYLYRLDTGDFSVSRKMTLLR